MQVLQDLFEKQLRDHLEFAEFATYLIVKKLKEEKAINLTVAQQKQLKEALQAQLDKDNLTDGLRIIIGDDGMFQVSIGDLEEASIIDISEVGESEIQSIIDKIPDVVKELVENFSQIFLQDFEKRKHSLLKDVNKDQNLFVKFLNSKWGTAIDLLELFILLTQEIGSEYNDYIRQSKNKELTSRFEVLSRSHARSCQVALEILVLLKSGFADGAHARWRTLHEIMVEANIIQNNDDDLAIRFLNHDIIQKYKSAHIYQKFYSELQLEPLSLDEMDNLEKSYNDLIRRYGKDFTNDYGWISHLIQGGRPKFVDLEHLAKFEHMRPFYKLACLNVHSGPRGLLFRLGLSDDQQKKFLLAGPSTNGLGDPIQNTAYSLLQTTSCLLTYDINIDYLVALNSVFQLEQDIFHLVDQIIHNVNSG